MEEIIDTKCQDVPVEEPVPQPEKSTPHVTDSEEEVFEEPKRPISAYLYFE